MRPRTTYKKLFKNSFKKSYNGSWLDFGYYFVSEVMNVYPFAGLNRKFLVMPACAIKVKIIFFILETNWVSVGMQHVLIVIVGLDIEA